MSDTNLNIALTYYQAMNHKDATTIEKCIHADITVRSPLAVVKGKEAVLKAAKGFYTFCENLEICAQFSADNQVMLAINANFPAPVGLIRTASLLTFKDDLIYEIELFYDPRAIESNQEKIFSKH